VTRPESSKRFRNFVTLYGVNRLAQAVGVHPSTVQDWKHGRSIPCDDKKAALVLLSERMLEEPPADIFGDRVPIRYADILDSRVTEFKERAKP
jgi:hypothetical protein